MKSESGRVVSTNRQDLNKLTLCLNIQVENPVLILNQDAARSFLKECDPKKLYELFLKATQIEAIVDKLHSCLKCATSSKCKLEQLERSIQAYDTEIIVIKEKHEKLQSVARLRNEIVAFKNELEWLKVAGVEKELKEQENQLNTIQSQVLQIVNLVKNKSKLEKELKDKICNFGTEFKNLNDVLKEKDSTSEGCRQQFEKEKDDLSSAEQILRNLVDRESMAAQNAAQLQADLDERENNPQNVDNIRKDNESKIKDCEKKKEDLALILRNARRDFNQFTDTLNEYQEKVETATQQMKRTQDQTIRIEGQIRQMQNSSKDALSVYGHSMTQMVKKLEQLYKQKKFAEMPRGPLGRYIEVTDKKYKSAVENILEGSLTSFLVSCDKDRILMSQVIKDYPDLQRTSIITSAFQNQVYDVRNGMVQIPHESGRVLMDVIKVSDPVVMNCLIDQRQIEQIVLVDDTNTAIEMTQDNENVPNNLLRAVLLKPFSEFYPAPNYRSYAIKEKPVRFIQTSYRDVIASLEIDKKANEEKYRQINQLIKQYQAMSKEHQKNVNDKKKLIGELQKKDHQYTQQLDELKSIEYPEENEADFLRKEMEELNKKQTQCSRKVKENEQNILEMKKKLKQNEEKLKGYREEARLARSEMTKVQLEMESAQQQLNEMNTDVRVKQNQLESMKAEEAILTATATNLKGIVRHMMHDIAGQRVPTDRSEEAIQQNIRMADKRIKNIENYKENIEEVALLLNNKIQQVDKMKQVRHALDQVLKTVS